MYARAYIYNPNINIHDGVVMRARMTQIQEIIREAELSAGLAKSNNDGDADDE